MHTFTFLFTYFRSERVSGKDLQVPSKSWFSFSQETKVAAPFKAWELGFVPPETRQLLNPSGWLTPLSPCGHHSTYQWEGDTSFYTTFGATATLMLSWSVPAQTGVGEAQSRHTQPKISRFTMGPLDHIELCPAPQVNNSESCLV